MNNILCQLAAIIASAGFLTLTGCAAIGAKGSYISTSGVAYSDWTTAKTENTFFDVSVEIDGHPPSFGLFGILIPIFPFYIFPSKLRLNLHISPTLENGQFVPGSVHLLNGGHQMEPSEIWGSVCFTGSTTKMLARSEWYVSQKLGKPCKFSYTFNDRPFGKFTVLIDGFPNIEIDTN